MAKKICDECGDKKPGPFYSDPYLRDFPIEESECLCADCYECALVDIISDMEDDMGVYKADLKKLRKEK